MRVSDVPDIRVGELRNITRKRGNNMTKEEFMYLIAAMKSNYKNFGADSIRGREEAKRDYC